MNLRGFRTEASYYTAADDTKLLRFIVDNGRHEDVGGVALWHLMVERKLLPGRSWQSMKESFRKSITRRLDQFPQLTEEQRQRLERGGEGRSGRKGGVRRSPSASSSRSSAGQEERFGS